MRLGEQSQVVTPAHTQPAPVSLARPEQAYARRGERDPTWATPSRSRCNETLRDLYELLTWAPTPLGCASGVG
jgi:hypothetical protein